MIYVTTKKVKTYGDPFGTDAGGRTRVGQLTTLLDGKTLGEDDPLLFQNVGTGSATYADNKVELGVTAGQYEVRQSKRFCPYFSGKSQLVEVTFDKFQLQAGVVKRAGYFSSNAAAPFDADYDGFWIESDGEANKYRVKCYRKGVETFNLDITGAVGSYDFSKFTVVVFDFLWLGGAIFRAFLKTQAGFAQLVEFNYSGTSQDVFILSPNQPIRYEIRSTTGAGTFRAVCSQVASEGSIDEAGKTLAVYNAASVTTNTVGTIYALKSVQKRATFRDTAIQILECAVANTATTDAGVLMLIVNPTLSAALTTVNNSKIVEGSPTNPAAPPTITAGTGRVVAAIPTGTTGGSSIMKENFLSFLSTNIDNTVDVYVLAYMPTTNNQTVNGAINIKEF